jgi:Fe-S-cluster containining protein
LIRASPAENADSSMDRRSAFSYVCNRCGLCCRNKVITLSPYDVIRIARAREISTGEAVDRYTTRRGSLLRFAADGRCAALDGARCSLHAGRPLACRLYPLGLERARATDAAYLERFVLLEPATGSLGAYGESETVAGFLDGQSVAPYLDALERYRSLIPDFRRRVDSLIDFERVEPREFWRRATREALAESSYDPNPLIDSLFDPDSVAGTRGSPDDTVSAHLAALRAMLACESDGARVAAAAVTLAVSLGYPPGEALADVADIGR